MNAIWTLAVCFKVVSFAVSGRTQNSSGATLYLVSGPEVVHAGTSTPLAVTVFGDFPGTVTAELGRGNTKVSLTEDFQEGLTSVLTLPPVSIVFISSHGSRGKNKVFLTGITALTLMSSLQIPDSLTQNSLLNLTVRGYKGNSVIFTNTTTLTFSPRNVSTFIQTDRSHYHPGDAVKVRAMCVQLDNHPYKDRVDLSVRDPSGNIVDRWESTPNLGIVLREFHLSQTAALGRWVIAATVNGVTDEKQFVVELYERPHFDVLIKTPSHILAGDDVSGSVRALYPGGRPLGGTLVVSLESAMSNTTSAMQTKEFYGSTQFFFSNDQLQALHTSSVSSDGRPTVHVTVSVNDSTTGFKVNKTVKVHLMQNVFQLTFHDFPPTLKPSLHFSTNLRISRYDRKPLSSVDLKHSAVVQINQITSVKNAEPTALILPVSEDGDVRIRFKLQAQVVTLFIQARFQSSEETLKISNNFSSPSDSYVQIAPGNTSAQIGLPLQINVESTFNLTKLHFVVSSKGQVVAAGTQNSSSFSLTPALSWAPAACVTVYCILSDGEITSDTAQISISRDSYVSLKWSSERAQPGEQVSLTVTGLESRSQLAVTVTGTHDDALQPDLNFKEEGDRDLQILTNTRLYRKNQPGPKNEGHAPEVHKDWHHWMDGAEALLWLDTNVSNRTWTSEKILVPDGITAMGALALVMSENLGLVFTPVLQKLTVSKDFSLSLGAPSLLIRGEEIVLEVKIINHLEQEMDVIVLLAQSKSFEFVLTHRKDASVINAQKVTVESHGSASALFPVRPLALGEVEISVDAVSAEASDSLVWRVMVKPEGVEQYFSQTLFLEMEPEKRNKSTALSFSFPPNVVPGSQRARVVLAGDILTLSINNLGSLVQLPLGCGEQNMIHFAPSVYVIQYLDTSNQDDQELRRKALAYMMEGYQKQLSYQREDGSFSAFGNSDTSGSTWLTAFVLRCFLQAQPYVKIDQSVLDRAVSWLLKHQGPQGEFSEVGRLIHTEMQGGLDKGTVALTAYVLIALLQDEIYTEIHEASVSLARKYLEDKVSSEVISNYSLCLTAYALALVNSPVSFTALTQLSKRADYIDGVMMWSSSAGLRSRNQKLPSAQIEMASYVLLAHINRGSLFDGITQMKWLSTQRNHLGGYGTTQDTVVALQALASYAAFSGANAINLMVSVSSPESSSLFRINATNYRTYQSQEIPAENDLHLKISMEGRGFATFQLNVFYHLERETFAENHQQAADEAFSLRIDAADGSDRNHMMLSVCTRLKDSQLIPHTGMVILDVGLLSGFTLSPEAAVQPAVIRKVETAPEKVILYLDSLNKSEVCINLPLVRNYKVARVHDAVARVYDYYEPTRNAMSTYNSRGLPGVDSCFFCGANCDLCRPGITITMSAQSMAAYSFSCLFLGLTVFLVLVS
ncbi:CD109 antigen-like isoform X2 [Simochromis diagramma]|uniref:CD109 antigen-like isoform X2 n=1 Tax=Simochromis diagramma TaxID=43689 RepID=UPI001A7EC47A|nr:CD109 antigen-like isoform X2 [Simochromis diagramma]